VVDALRCHSPANTTGPKPILETDRELIERHLLGATLGMWRSRYTCARRSPTAWPPARRICRLTVPHPIHEISCVLAHSEMVAQRPHCQAGQIGFELRCARSRFISLETFELRIRLNRRRRSWRPRRIIFCIRPDCWLPARTLLAAAQPAFQVRHIEVRIL
jgi:hypothetical protein